MNLNEYKVMKLMYGKRKPLFFSLVTVLMGNHIKGVRQLSNKMDSCPIKWTN
jgi:hypothetical protein